MASSSRIKHCALCQNHGCINLKRKHICKFEKCVCYFCDLTKMCQKAMRHQQRLWRHQKQALKKYTQNIKGQACDKCRNHDTIVEKKSHICPRAECNCKLCDLNNTRKVLLKHQQRVRRAKVTSQQLVESREEGSNNFLQDLNNIEEAESTNSSSSIEEIRLSLHKTNMPPGREEYSPPKNKKVSEESSSNSVLECRKRRLSSPHEEEPNNRRHLDSPPPLIPIRFCYSPKIGSSSQPYEEVYPDSSKPQLSLRYYDDQYESQSASLQTDYNSSACLPVQNLARNPPPVFPRSALNYEEFSLLEQSELRHHYEYPPLTRFMDYQYDHGIYGGPRQTLETIPSSSRRMQHAELPCEERCCFENLSMLKDSLDNEASYSHQ